MAELAQYWAVSREASGTVANLMKTMRFEATRTMRLAKDGRPIEATMPCHVSLNLTAPKPVSVRAMAEFDAVCAVLGAYLKALDGKVVDANLLPCKADAASLANHLARDVVAPELAGTTLKLDRLHVMYGVIEQAAAGPRKAATIQFAWDSGEEPPPPQRGRFGKMF